MSRRRYFAIAVPSLIAFLAVSVLVTRVITAGNAERTAAVEVVKAQARGDTAELIRQIDGCSARPACRARAQRLATSLRRNGQIDVLTVRTPGFSVRGRTGRTRIAWTEGDGDPIVQCVTARRRGNPFSGYEVDVLSLSGPVGGEGSC